MLLEDYFNFLGPDEEGELVLKGPSYCSGYFGDPITTDDYAAIVLRDFGDRVAELLGAPGNAQVSAAATLCATAIVPAISAVLQGEAPPKPSGSPQPA